MWMVRVVGSPCGQSGGRYGPWTKTSQFSDGSRTARSHHHVNGPSRPDHTVKHWNRYFNIAICRYIEIDICEKWLSIDISGHMANISAISDNIGCYQEGPRGDHFVVKVVHFHYISTISLPFLHFDF